MVADEDISPDIRRYVFVKLNIFFTIIQLRTRKPPKRMRYAGKQKSGYFSSRLLNKINNFFAILGIQRGLKT